MKKILICVLMFLFCLLLVSESKARDPLNAAQRAWVKKHGTIRVGAFEYYPPFGFMDISGEAQGMSIDFWRLLSSKLDIWVQFCPATFNDQLEGLKSGKYDSLAGIFSLTERRRFFEFSMPYTVIRTSIYVKPKHSHLRGLSELRGLRVGAVEGDSGQVVAQKAGLNPLSFMSYRQAIFNVANGNTDAIIMDEPVVAYFVAQHDLQDLVKKIGQPVDQGKMTLPVRKGNRVLLDILNKGISMVASNEWKRIVDKWMK